MGSTVSTIVRIRNLTLNDVTSVYVDDIDSFDFGSRFRPDSVLNGTSIPAGSCIEKMIELNSIASNCPFTMKLAFQNGTLDTFKINSKSSYDSTEANLRHIKKSHCIYCKKPGPRILEIVIQHTPEQKENQKAEETNKEGALFLAAGRFEEASIKFLEALQKANEDETKAAIRRNMKKLESMKGSDIDKKADGINKEGLQFLKENKYQQAIMKFTEALKIAKNVDTINQIENNLKEAKEAKINQEAKMLSQEGLILRKNNENEKAVMKFDEALKSAVDINLINSIKTNKAETLCKQALVVLENAWLNETSLNDKTEEAIHNFAKAKYLLEEANSVKSDPKYRQIIDTIETKIAGNKFYNIAVQLENEASILIDKTVKHALPSDCAVAKEKYYQAWKYYKEAKKKFEDGVKKDDKFKFSIELTEEALNEVENMISELEKGELEIISS